VTATPTSSPTGTPALAIDDIDGDGETDGLTDGVLKIRWMFGFRDDALIASPVDLAGCTRCNADAVETYLSSIVDQLDIDDDGEVEPLTDGLLNLRYLFGLRDDELITGAVDADCVRCLANEIEGYLESLN
jgi:hypothetical protein